MTTTNTELVERLREAIESALLSADVCGESYGSKALRIMDKVNEVVRSMLEERERLREALGDFVASAALIGNTASEIAPLEIAKQGALAWARCLNNGRAALNAGVEEG